MFFVSHPIVKNVFKFRFILKTIGFLSILALFYYAFYLRIHTGTKYHEVGVVMTLLFSAAFVSLVILSIRQFKSMDKIHYYLIFIIPIVFVTQAFYSAYKDGRIHTIGKYYDYYKLQEWTRLNTKKTDIFLLLDRPSYYGWRGYTGRALLTKNVSNAYYVPEKGAEFRHKLYLFFKEQSNIGNSTSSSICFKCLNHDGFFALREKFGVIYVVGKPLKGTNMNTVFSTNHYNIYEINDFGS